MTTQESNAASELKSAYKIAVGVPAGGVAFMALGWPLSVPALLFAVSTLSIPVAIDIHKHGKNNILTSSKNEYMEAFRIVAADLKSRMGLTGNTTPPPDLKP